MTATSDRRISARVLRALALACLLACGCAVLAQSRQEKPSIDYGVLFGTVYNAESVPVYGVTVKIRRASDKKARWETMSDHSGEFAERVPTGDYVVWADVKTKDKKKAKPEVKVHIDNGMRTDVSLHLTE